MGQDRKEDGAIRVAAVDDHTLFLAGLDHLLNRESQDMVCHCFDSGRSLLQALDAGADFDVVVTDLTMKELNGLALITAIRARGITAQCIILSASEDAISRESSARLGAFRFLHKSDDPEALKTAIREANAAMRPAPTALAAAEGLRVENPTGEEYAVVPMLGPRQLRVLELLAAGHSNKDISDALCISENTVKTHLKAIYRELGVKSRTAAATRGRELSLI